MATKDQLERALRKAHAAGDSAAARRFALAIKNQEFEQTAPTKPEVVTEAPTEKPGIMDRLRDAYNKADRAFTNAPGMDVLSEGAAAINRGVFNLLDIVPGAANDVLGALGSETRLPGFNQKLGARDFMEPGTARDMVQAGGELVGPSVLGGGLLRAGASALPKIASGAESVGAGILRGFANTTARGDAGAALASGAGSVAGGDAAEEMGVDRRYGEFVGGMGAPMLPAAAGAATRTAVAGGKKGLDNLRTNLQAFDETGAVPSVGTLSESGGAKLVESFSARGPFTKSFTRSVEDTAAKTQARLQQIADDLSTTSGLSDVGSKVQAGIRGDTGFTARFRDRSKALWDKVYDAIPANEALKPEKTLAALRSLTSKSEVEKSLTNPTLKRLRDDIETAVGPAGGIGSLRISPITGKPLNRETIDFSSLRALRSKIGSMLDDNSLVSDVPRRELKQVYAAMSDDIRGLAEKNGAAAAWRKANGYTKAGHERIDNYLQKIADKVDPDKVAASLVRGGDGIKYLTTVKKSLKPDEWEAVAAETVRRLGRSTARNQDDVGGEFDMSKFLADWNKLGDAKDVMFSGSKKLKDYRHNLDRIAKSAAIMKRSGGHAAAQQSTVQGQLPGAVGSTSALLYASGSGNLPLAATVMAGIGANVGVSRLMTSPRFVKWLASAPDATSPAAHVAKLTGIAASEGLGDEINELLTYLKDSGQQNVNADGKTNVDQQQKQN